MRLLAYSGGRARFAKLDNFGFGCYAVNERIGLCVKHSTSRITPWTFTFQDAHREALNSMQATYSDTIVVLVCDEDGIATIDYASAMRLLDGDSSGQWNITVARKPRAMYAISGTGGTLERKYADGDIARELLAKAAGL